MKIVRFLDEQSKVKLAALQQDGAGLEIEGDLFGEWKVTDRKVKIGKLLAPIDPRAIWCVGLNYRKHAEETKAKTPEYPVLFMKSIGAVQHPNEPILLPKKLESTFVDYEGEFAVVIGKTCKNVSHEKALDYVLGYMCANDVSARDWQKSEKGGGQWSRGKTFDTFCPLGPCLTLKDEIPNPNDLYIRTTLNGEVMQDSHTNDMIFDIPSIIEFYSSSTTLLAGTVILTGTPSGAGMAREPKVRLQEGDVVTVEIEKIGQLTNPVKTEQL